MTKLWGEVLISYDDQVVVLKDKYVIWYDGQSVTLEDQVFWAYF